MQCPVLGMHKPCHSITYGTNPNQLPKKYVRAAFTFAFLFRSPQIKVLVFRNLIGYLSRIALQLENGECFQGPVFFSNRAERLIYSFINQDKKKSRWR